MTPERALQLREERDELVRVLEKCRPEVSLTLLAEIDEVLSRKSPHGPVEFGESNAALMAAVAGDT